MTENPSLGLVIPVWNDQALLDRLLRQTHTMNLFDQVVVVDDGSDAPVSLPVLTGLNVQLIHHDSQQGAGPARNRGFHEITTSHVLFFDSDDLLTSEMPLLWQDLQEQDFDMCLFRHCDSRQAAQGHWGLMPYDADLWQQAGMGGRALTQTDMTGRTALARTANYPWNKIWRTDMLRMGNIRFPTTKVHEDIVPHWLGFACAETLLVSDRIAAIHHVMPVGERLTNLRGPERLDVFGPLADVLSELQKAPPDRAPLLPAFWMFCAGLLDWIKDNIEPCWHSELAQRQAAFWQQAIGADQRAKLIEDTPALAARLEQFIDLEMPR